MTGLRDRKKSKVRTAIYEAALRLFEAEGYDAVSVERIATEAGIAKGTFFNHFASKADILSAWHEASSEARSAQAGERPASLRDAVLSPAIDAVGFAVSHPALWAATIRETPTNPSLRQLEAASDARLRQHYEQALREAAKSGAISPSADPAILARLLVTLLTGCVREWVVLETRPHTLAEHVTLTLDQFLDLLGYARDT